MKQYFTKTGIELKLIQGNNQGDGIPSGLLKLVSSNDTRETDIASIHASMRSLYEMAVAKLSLSQYKAVMGGDMSFVSKATKIMKVSSCKTVHLYCRQILELGHKLAQIKAA